MIIELKDKRIEERIKHLNKAIEIVGGNEILISDNSSSKIIEEIVKSVLEGKGSNILIKDREYTIEELYRIKIDFEKYFLKNKFKIISRIVEKIKKYNTELESKIREFKKTNSLEDFREISKEVEEKYKWEFDRFLLVNVESLDENKSYYGEYLSEKKKQLIDSIFVKLGI